MRHGRSGTGAIIEWKDESCQRNIEITILLCVACVSPASALDENGPLIVDIHYLIDGDLFANVEGIRDKAILLDVGDRQEIYEHHGIGSLVQGDRNGAGTVVATLDIGGVLTASTGVVYGIIRPSVYRSRRRDALRDSLSLPEALD